MKLTHPDYHFEVSFAEDVFPVIVIERSDTFRSYVSELYEEIHGGDGKFVLSRDWKPLDIAKNTVFISDMLDMHINERKYINPLVNQLSYIALSETCVAETVHITHEISTWLVHLENETILPITHEQPIDISGIIKAAGVQFDIEGSNVVEKFDNLIKICSGLIKVTLVICVGLHAYATRRELEILYRTAMQQKMHIMSIERHLPDQFLDCEKAYIIDEDLCEIY